MQRFTLWRGFVWAPTSLTEGLCLYIVEEDLYVKEAEVTNTWNPKAACWAGKLLWEALWRHCYFLNGSVNYRPSTQVTRHQNKSGFFLRCEMGKMKKAV